MSKAQRQTRRRQLSPPSFVAPSDPALDDKAAAAYLGVKPQTLAVWRCTGRYDLPFEKIGARVRYRQSALDAFRARRTYTSTGEAEATA
jgi:helix-turn-helix protein